MTHKHFMKCLSSTRDIVLGTRTRSQSTRTRTRSQSTRTRTRIFSTRTRSRGTCILRYLTYWVCLVHSLPVAFYFLASSR